VPSKVIIDNVRDIISAAMNILREGIENEDGGGTWGCNNHAYSWG
jgi:hypothetical protein